MKTIGRYEVREILGRGGMSVVYKVKLPVIERIAALKLFAPSPKLVELTGLDHLREQFIQEASMVAHIRHPHVIDIWRLEEADDHLFYLMEYFCHDLGSIIGESYWADALSRTIPIEKAIQYTLQILDGLQRLHDAGIIHRDIKPFNIMITDQDEVKIADFGLSIRRGETSKIPETQTVIGTKSYAAPEQIESPEQVTYSADLYSIGVMLYRMLFGRLPASPLPATSDLNPNLDFAWDCFFSKALAQTPETRFSRASDMSNDLGQLLESYREKQAKVCQLIPQNQENVNPDLHSVSPAKIQLRSKSIQVTAQRAKTIFGVDDLWRPTSMIRHDLKPFETNWVADETTGLLWEKSGFAYPLNWDQARAYVDSLNETRFGGKNTWRLPTVNELLSIINSPAPGGLSCIEPLFDSRQKWLWSIDQKSNRARWYINVEMGYVWAHDATGFFYVRGVCDLSAFQ